MTRLSKMLPLLALLLAATSPLAAQDKTRRLEIEGVDFTLPENWEWESQYAKNIAIVMPVEVDGRQDKAKAELYFYEGQFIGDKLELLEAKAGEEHTDMSGLEIQANQNFQGNRAYEATYDKTRGTGDSAREYEVRHYYFRRYGHLYEWREEVPKELDSRTMGDFRKARSALEFRKPANPIVTERRRRYVLQDAIYTLPPDWNWSGGPEGREIEIDSKVEGNTIKAATLFKVRSTHLNKGQRIPLKVTCRVFKSDRKTARQLFEENKEGILGQFKDVEDVRERERARFGRERALAMTWKGRPKEAQANAPLQYFRVYFFKHKRYLFQWVEATLAGRERQAEMRFRVARKGLRMM